MFACEERLDAPAEPVTDPGVAPPEVPPPPSKVPQSDDPTLLAARLVAQSSMLLDSMLSFPDDEAQCRVWAQHARDKLQVAYSLVRELT